MAVSPSPSNAAEVVLTFLESVGRRSEAELYLRLFRKLPKESFAVIAPGGPVVRQALGSLLEQLRFLGDLGLFAPLVLGLFDPETAPASSERLFKRLPSAGLEACAHSMDEPELAERVREELRAERVPVIHFVPREGSSVGQRVTELGALTRALDTRKVVLLRRRGGIAPRGERVLNVGPSAPPATGGRVSVINLRTDADTIVARRLGKRDGELVETASALIQVMNPSPLLVSVTSPLNLLKELFTVKGAGTLIKPGTAIDRHRDYEGVDVERLRTLLEASFARSLSGDFFARQPLAVYVEAAYRGAAIVHAEPPAPYLTKFAVEPEAQGEGIGNDLWHAMLRDFPKLFWRGRPDNPINSWYQAVCDGMIRLPRWTVFWRGVEPEAVPAVVETANALPADFAAPT